jgi:DNA-binding MurR/RpiR family transcriptional regulator
VEIKEDLSQKISSNYKDMSKGQKAIAAYLLNSFDKAAYMTAVKLGETVNVSESTVVRFAYMLGYDGYPKLQKALQEMLRNKLTSAQRAEIVSGLETSTVLRSTLKADMDNIRLTIEEADSETFEKVVDSILNARSIYILGLRSALPLVQFMGYYFNFIFDNVRVVTSGVNDIFEQLIHVGRQDVIIAISFPRYARRTVEAIAFSKDKGAKIIAITDSLLSPLTTYADHTLLARSDMASFADSLVAPLSLINALITAVGIRKKADTSVEFSDLEKIWDKYKVYVGKDDV